MAGGSQSVRRRQHVNEQEPRRRRHGMRLKFGASGGRLRRGHKLLHEELDLAGIERGGRGEDGAGVKNGWSGASGGGGGGGVGALPSPPSAFRVSARKLAASKWAEIDISAHSPPLAASRPSPLRSRSPDTHPLHPSDASLSCSPRVDFPSLPSSLKPPVVSRKSPQLRSDSCVAPEAKKTAFTHLHLSQRANGHAHCATLESSLPMYGVAVLAKRLHAGEPDLPSSPRNNNDNDQGFDRLQSVGEQNSDSTSVVPALRNELELARVRLQKLDVAKKLARKEVDNLLERYANESTIRKNREQKKVEASMLYIGKQLEEERKIRKKLELQYTELSRNLSTVNKAAAKALNELEKERNARRLMEEICDELAREIGADRAEFEELKREHAKATDEIEEERLMFQTAQAWREERVQVKFSEARIELEERCMALDKLRAELEAFLSSKRTHQPEGGLLRQDEVNQAEMLRDCVGKLLEQTVLSVHSIEDTVRQSVRDSLDDV